jgi:spore maturation protein A
MLNVLWIGLVLASILIGFFNGTTSAVVAAVSSSAQQAVTIAIGLIGVMGLWLGIMRIAEDAGFVKFIGRLLNPLMKRLFPEVPSEHPAMGAMTLNIAANMLGLGNAATPFGLRAMEELNKLNSRPGVASNAMCTFLALNTSSLQLIPTTAIAILAANGDVNAATIIFPTLLATSCSTIVAVVVVKVFEKFPFRAKYVPELTVSE